MGGCEHSGHRTLKLAVSQEVINGINKSFAWWYKFRKAKSYCDNYWVCLIENELGLFIHGNRNSSVCQEWIVELTWFLHADTNSGKLKVTVIIFEWL